MPSEYTDTRRRRPCDKGSGVQQGLQRGPRGPSQPPEGGERTQPCRHLDFRLLPPRAVSESTPCLSPPVWDSCSLSRLTQSFRHGCGMWQWSRPQAACLGFLMLFPEAYLPAVILPPWPYWLDHSMFLPGHQATPPSPLIHHTVLVSSSDPNLSPSLILFLNKFHFIGQ